MKAMYLFLMGILFATNVAVTMPGKGSKPTSRDAQIAAACQMAKEGAKKCGSSNTPDCKAMKEMAKGYCADKTQPKKR